MQNVNRKLVFVLGAAVLLFSLLCVGFNMFEVKASNGNHVRNLNTGLNYTTIQEAIDAASTLDGHKISVDEGTYSEHLTVGKSISLIGENQNTTIIQGNGTDTVIHVTANSVTIKGFMIKNGTIGIHVDRSNDSLIEENNVIDNNGDAVLISYSKNCSIYNNLAGNNTGRGILFTNTQDFISSGNTVYGSGVYGLNANSSINGLIAQNNVYQNYFDGIGLYDSNSCSVIANNVINNTFFGISCQSSYNASIYHNNIFNNGIQVAVAGLTIMWDDGVEGNYWSNYTGVDLNYDGIGDTEHVIDASNIDHFPLIGMFNDFDTSYDYQVNIVSNSSISDFGFSLVNSSYAALTFNVSGETGSQGFCRLRIPKALINSSYTVKFDGVTLDYSQVRELQPSNETFEYFYINYTHSDHRIEIVGTTTVPEPPPASMLVPIVIIATLIIATLLAIIIYRRKKTK
jgi:parallel beta-helix repeat protein